MGHLTTVSQQNVPKRLLVRALQQDLDSGGRQFLWPGGNLRQPNISNLTYQQRKKSENPGL